MGCDLRKLFCQSFVLDFQTKHKEVLGMHDQYMNFDSLEKNQSHLIFFAYWCVLDMNGLFWNILINFLGKGVQIIYKCIQHTRLYIKHHLVSLLFRHPETNYIHTILCRLTQETRIYMAYG